MTQTTAIEIATTLSPKTLNRVIYYSAFYKTLKFLNENFIITSTLAKPTILNYIIKYSFISEKHLDGILFYLNKRVNLLKKLDKVDLPRFVLYLIQLSHKEFLALDNLTNINSLEKLKQFNTAGGKLTLRCPKAIKKINENLRWLESKEGSYFSPVVGETIDLLKSLTPEMRKRLFNCTGVPKILNNGHRNWSVVNNLLNLTNDYVEYGIPKF